MSETPITEDELDFDEWLDAGTVARRAVQIFNKPDLAAEYDILALRLADAQENEQQGADATMGEASEVQSILDAMTDLNDRWEASKATFILRALEEDEVKAILEAFPDDPLPKIMGDEEAKKADPASPLALERAAAVTAWVTKHDEMVTERNLAMIAASVVEVRTSRGVRKSISVEQVRRLRKRAHGKTQTARLLEAVQSATTGDVDVPRPTLPGRSENARG